MATTTPENASETYKSQIRGIAGGPVYGNTLIAFGDSIGHILDSNEPSANSFINWANIILKQRFNMIEAGVSSDTTTDMLARYQTDVIDVDSDLVVCYGGTNDPGVAITSATAITNLTTMSDAIIADGRKFIFCTIMPSNVNDDVNATGTARREYMTTVNDWARRRALTKRNFYTCDTEATITDSSTGIPQANYTTDGLHLSYTGVMYPAQLLAETLNFLYPVAGTGVQNPLDSKNLIGPFVGVPSGDNASGVNGFTLGTGITGTGPNGWYTWRTSTGTGVSSGDVARVSPSYIKGDVFGRMEVTAVADDDGAGFHIGGSDVGIVGRWDGAVARNTAYGYNDKKHAGTGWVSHTTFDEYQYFVVVPGTTHASTEPDWANLTTEGELWVDGTVTWMTVKKPQIGDEIYGEVEIQTSSLSGTAAIGVSLHFQYGATAVILNAIRTDRTATIKSDYLPPTMSFRTLNYTLPAGLSAGTIRYITMKVMGYGDAGTTYNLDVTRIGVYNASNLG